MVVCPRCREHAQIIETGKKTVSCQHCGARLQARKLRVFYSSDELEKTVAARTLLQAELSGKEEREGEEKEEGEKIFSGKLSAEIGNSKPVRGNDGKLSRPPANRTSKPVSLKKDPRTIILESLEAGGGKMGTEELREKTLERGLSPEKFEETLKKLQEAGELYFPAGGEIKIV